MSICEDCSLRRLAKKHISIKTHFCCEILWKMPRRSDSESQPSQNEICTKLFQEMEHLLHEVFVEPQLNYEKGIPEVL